MTGPVSREEVHILRAAIAENSRRIEQTQTTATGLAVLSVQVGEVVKDVGALGAELAEHRRAHEAAAASRAAARRWAFGFAVAALASLWAPLVYLIGHGH